MKVNGRVAQLVDNQLSKQKAASSNPESTGGGVSVVDLLHCLGSYWIYAASQSTQLHAREIVCEG